MQVFVLIDYSIIIAHSAIIMLHIFRVVKSPFLFRGVSVRCFFEASSNVPGYMSSGYRLLLQVQPQKRQSPGHPSELERHRS